MNVKVMVMKRAHQIAKEMVGHYVARLSLALRQAWKEMKGMLVELKGSEKQVKWANQIREEKLAEIDKIIARWKKRLERDVDLAEDRVSGWKSLRDSIRQIDDSRFFINNRNEAITRIATMLGFDHILPQGGKWGGEW